MGVYQRTCLLTYQKVTSYHISLGTESVLKVARFAFSDKRVPIKIERQFRVRSALFRDVVLKPIRATLV